MKKYLITETLTLASYLITENITEKGVVLVYIAVVLYNIYIFYII